MLARMKYPTSSHEGRRQNGFQCRNGKGDKGPQPEDVDPGPLSNKVFTKCQSIEDNGRLDVTSVMEIYIQDTNNVSTGALYTNHICHQCK